MWCVTRSELVNFWNFRCRKRSKKGLLQLWLLRALQIFFLTYFQKPMGFYLLTNRDSSMGKVWGKTFFRCQIPWTALTEVATQVLPRKRNLKLTTSRGSQWGEPLAVKRPKSLAVRCKNWQILTNSCKNKLTVRKKQSSGDNNGMV